MKKEINDKYDKIITEVREFGFMLVNPPVNSLFLSDFSKILNRIECKCLLSGFNGFFLLINNLLQNDINKSFTG